MVELNEYEVSLMSPKAPSVVMPIELTAENGAKGLLIGEFYETVEVDNPEYCGCGECDWCRGAGLNEPQNFDEKVPVSWTNIKEIYKKAVENLGQDNSKEQTIKDLRGINDAAHASAQTQEQTIKDLEIALYARELVLKHRPTHEEHAALTAKVEAVKDRQIPEGWYLTTDNNGNREIINRAEAVEREAWNLIGEYCKDLNHTRCDGDCLDCGKPVEDQPI